MTSSAPMRIDLGTLLRTRAAQQPDKQFVTMVGTGESLSYRGFNERVNRAANGLTQLGVRHASYVNVMLTNSLDRLVVSYALKKLGAVEVAVNPEARGQALARMITISEAPVLVTSSDLLSSVQADSSALLHTRYVVLCSDGSSEASGRLAANTLPFSDLCNTAADEPETQVSDLDTAVVIFTSGTTGPSKGCVLPHRALIRAGESVVDAMSMTDEDRVFTPYPLFHMRAAYLDVLSALLVGGSAVIAPKFSASRFWRDMHDYEITLFSLLGTVMQILWKTAPSEFDRNHQVRLTWGGPITVDRQAFEERFGVAVLPGEGVFGMSETGMLNMSSFDSKTSGVVRSIYDVRIGDHQDDPVDDIGEILVRPTEPGVMFSGYLNMPEESLSALRGQWFHTGDLGRMDADGRLVYVGRKREMIRHGGHNISTYEVEEVINSHPEVIESAAVGIPNPLGEEDVKVFVQLQPGSELNAESLIAYCGDRMATYMVPQAVTFVPEFPKTSTGKIITSQLLRTDPS